MKKLELHFPSMNTNHDEKITSKFLTKYEKTRLISTRALQIANNSQIFTEVGDLVNAKDIARKEFEEGTIPLSIRRILPNGNIEEFSVNEIRNK